MKKYLPVIIIFCFCSCIKDDTKVTFTLPAETQSGKNTFGCLLNSTVCMNYGRECFLFAAPCRDNLIGYYYRRDGFVSISADMVLYKHGGLVSATNFDINFNTRFKGVGTYSFSTNDTIDVAYIYNKSTGIDSMYTVSQIKPQFSVTITKLDTVNNILSGEFSGKLFKRIDYTNLTTSLTDSVNVNSGRFDIKMN